MTHHSLIQPIDWPLAAILFLGVAFATLRVWPGWHEAISPRLRLALAFLLIFIFLVIVSPLTGR